MSANINLRQPVISIAMGLSLVGCQQVEGLTSQFSQGGGGQSASASAPSCDPGFSLAGFFDDRPEILIKRPAKNPEAGDLQRIAVIPPNGDGSNEFTQRFESALASVKVGGQPYFQVVSRADLDEALAKQGLSRSGKVGVGSAAKVGRLLDVDGVYIPQILSYDVADTSYQATGEPGRCTKRTASFKSIPKLVDVGTGQVVYAKEQGGSREERYCPRGGGGVDGGLSQLKSFIGQGGLPEGEAMMTGIMDAAMTSFTADIAPQSCMKRMNVLADSEGLSNDASIDQFEGAVAFMKSGRYDRACPAWQTLEASGEKTVSLYNNLSICAEIDNQLVLARGYCSKADVLLTRPNEAINQCIETTEKRLTESAGLRVAGCEPLVERADVREAQQLLSDNGYLTGAAADGLVGPGTIEAVIDFQTDTGLPIEGHVNACLLDDLRGL